MKHEELKIFMDKQLKEMKECDRLDTEYGHIKADDILCECLKTMGYEEIVKVYESLNKWYA